MPTYRARYQVIRELRDWKRITQEEAWQTAGIAQGTYQAMENKKAYEEGREFKEANLEAVATLFGVELPDIAIGFLKAKPARWLLSELDRIRERSREANQRLHTPHILLGMMALQDSVFVRAIEKETTLSPTKLRRGLERNLQKIALELGPFRDFVWEENRYFLRALEYAALRRREATDGDLCLAVLRLGLSPPVSSTVAWIRRKLGDEAFVNVLIFMRDYSPPDVVTPAFPESTLS